MCSVHQTWPSFSFSLGSQSSVRGFTTRYCGENHLEENMSNKRFSFVYSNSQFTQELIKMNKRKWFLALYGFWEILELEFKKITKWDTSAGHKYTLCGSQSWNKNGLWCEKPTGRWHPLFLTYEVQQIILVMLPNRKPMILICHLVPLPQTYHQIQTIYDECGSVKVSCKGDTFENWPLGVCGRLCKAPR